MADWACNKIFNQSYKIVKYSHSQTKIFELGDPLSILVFNQTLYFGSGLVHD